MIYRFINKDRQKLVFLAVFLLLAIGGSVNSDELDPKTASLRKAPQHTAAADNPVLEYTAHNRGNMQLAIGNNGTFGTGGRNIPDPFTGDQITSCVYPKNSDIVYLWVGALWIGAVVGRDTLVSCATEDWYTTQEFWPTQEFTDQSDTRAGFQYQSIDEGSPFYSPDARSEQDIICEYDDSRTDPNLVAIDPTDNRPHKPLGIKIHQRSMAWSYAYADDFVLFDYQIENVGNEILKEVYMGVFVDGDVWHVSRNGPDGWNDDIVGFYRVHPSEDACGFVDTVNIAYAADNDGDPADGAWDERSATGVVGAKLVRTPSDSLRYSFNWWTIDYSDPTHDFGPRKRGTEADPFRSFGARLGTPTGDRNKYYVMKHPEFDYDLLYTGVDHSRDGWLPPPERADDLADGFDVRYLLSFGPFEIHPGEKLPITFAWVGGTNFHVKANDFDSFDPLNPDAYYNKLDFTGLTENSRWASWVYDNPGVDTDSDGFAGKYNVCCYDSTQATIDTTIDGRDTTITVWRYNVCDTTYYEGDGVPDFRGASPPPAPEFWVEPSVGKLRVRFNGLRSETSVDQFSGESDFEGYRIYIARDNRQSSFSLVASYDHEDYNKYVWNNNRLPEAGYSLLEDPFTIEELRCLYGDSCNDMSFDPQSYTRSAPFILPTNADSIFYFEPQDFNASQFGVNTPIRKVYPDQPFPSSLNPDSVSTDELTPEGRLKYFEYEFTIDNLLPTIPYYVNVTAFDFGSPKSGLKAMESSLVNGAIVAYPLESVDSVEDKSLSVYVYPNPYHESEDYEGRGYENRTGFLAPDRAHLIHFANLPRVCKISIYSLDGDLIKSIDHNYPEGGPEAMHESWDLITRNTQLIVSGLYYYVVESNTGTQIGKFVIIR